MMRGCCSFFVFFLAVTNAAVYTRSMLRPVWSARCRWQLHEGHQVWPSHQTTSTWSLVVILGLSRSGASERRRLFRILRLTRPPPRYAHNVWSIKIISNQKIFDSLLLHSFVCTNKLQHWHILTRLWHGSRGSTVYLWVGEAVVMVLSKCGMLREENWWERSIPTLRWDTGKGYCIRTINDCDTLKYLCTQVHWITWIID